MIGYYAGRTPTLLVTDVEFGKALLTTHFAYFTDQEAGSMMTNRSDPIMSRNPFFQKGAQWKENRRELAPSMSKSRIRLFHPIMKEVCKKLTSYLEDKCKKSCQVDIQEVMSRFTCELLSDVVFGVAANAFKESRCHVWENAQKYINGFAKITRFHVWTGIFPLLKIFYKFRIMAEEQRNFFYMLLKESMDIREQGRFRMDNLQWLTEWKEKRGNLNRDDLLAAAMSFYLDGYDTTGVGIVNALQWVRR